MKKTPPQFHVARLTALCSLACILTGSNAAFGLGTLLPDQDAFATARGNAFVATADNNSAVFYNPAGITQLEGMGFSMNGYGITYSSRYKGAFGEINSKQQGALLPQVFSDIKLPYGFTFGLGTYSPYGLRMEWPDNSILSIPGQTGEIDYLTLNPVLAYQINSNLSIAAGATLNYSEADFKLNPGFLDHFRGRDTAAGFNAGILWHPWQQHSFGLTYRSATDMNYNGHATVPPGPNNAPATANFHFPQTLALGYSYRPTEKWNFEVDGNWSDWTTFRTVTVNPFGENFPFNWKPSWMFDFGATRYFGKGWHASAGYMYVMNTVPDDTFNALIPDSDRHIFSVGVGKSYDKFHWDVAYQFLWGPTRSVTADTQYGGLENGNYEFFGHAISINFGYRF